MKSKHPLSIFWFRRDLRLDDNRALCEACQNSDKVLAMFIFDKKILSKLKNKFDKRVQFIYESLLELNSKLDKNNSQIYICYGNPINILPQLAKTYKAQAVYCNEDYEPYAKNRDYTIKQKLEKKGVHFYSFKDHVIFSGNEILKKDQTPYKIFTPYKNEWLKRISLQDVKEYKIELNNLLKKTYLPKNEVHKLEDLGFHNTNLDIISGSTQAKIIFKIFLKKIHHYHEDRNFVSKESSSQLSPYLRFGNISLRSIFRSCWKLKSQGAQSWVSELIWREFYQMILDQFPHVQSHSYIERFDQIHWPGKKENLRKWKAGQTGFPLIDAAMKHFAQTGKMHNRNRMIVASFLVKDLLIDWRVGEKYFAENLLDFDLAANNGNWQWCASTGCDPQPYFRIFNPITQSQKFDPNGEFIKTHLPKLKNFPKKYIHFPSMAPKEIQIKAGCIIGKDYPYPIIDHNIQRNLALKLYQSYN